MVEVEVEMTMDKAPEVDIKPIKQKMEECTILEEDPEMYAMAGLEPCACASPC